MFGYGFWVLLVILFDCCLWVSFDLGCFHSIWCCCLLLLWFDSIVGLLFWVLCLVVYIVGFVFDLLCCELVIALLFVRWFLSLLVCFFDCWLDWGYGLAFLRRVGNLFTGFSLCLLVCYLHYGLLAYDLLVWVWYGGLFAWLVVYLLVSIDLVALHLVFDLNWYS